MLAEFVVLQFVVYVVVAAFIGVTVLGHVLVVQAMFTKTDDADGEREKIPARGSLSRFNA